MRTQDILTELLHAPGVDTFKANQACLNGDSPLVMAIKLGLRSFAKRIFAAVHKPTRKVVAEELTVDFASRLGQGGFGAVLKGSWNGRTVAIKTGLQMNDFDSLEKEVRAMELCESPYLLQLLGVTKAPHVQLVLEYMDAGDLRNYLDKKRAGVPVSIEYPTLNVAWVIANALADLHNAGLVHRDLKSNNVLLSSTNYIKVAGLGLARNDASKMTTGVGTESWMAPEVQVPGTKYDASADIYSFGVILTELNTLQMPYADVKLAKWAIMAEVAAGRLRPNLRDDCPAWLRELATACMTHDPKQRPSAYDIVRKLQHQRRLERLDVIDRARSPECPIDAQSSALLVSTAVACLACGAKLSLKDSTCPTCEKPVQSDATKLEILLQRIELSDAPINIILNCSVCETPAQIREEVCPDAGCGALLPSAAAKVYTLCRRIELANKTACA
ncbi:protein kinase [Achlya hypogyna]|uniref:Protein kinase n=1 Tax=Achlya hypogyna TaxID=1202772 RepID=A0A1V9YAU2_ACHHY|nr:protein kinase [Achlya hypogyna]